MNLVFWYNTFGFSMKLNLVLREFLVGGAQSKQIHGFGNKTEKGLFLKNVSWNLFGNGVLVTKPKTKSKVIFLHRPFLVFWPDCVW